jgi:hypothetical protein
MKGEEYAIAAGREAGSETVKAPRLDRGCWRRVLGKGGLWDQQQPESGEVELPNEPISAIALMCFSPIV